MLNPFLIKRKLKNKVLSTKACKMRKILITGGAGFIGSHLAEKLLEKGYKVYVIDNLSTGKQENIAHLLDKKNFQFIKETVLNEKIMERLIKKVDEIYHLAAAVGVKYIVENPLDSLITNIKGTEIVLELASKYKKKVLLASTSEIYGKNKNVPFKETDDRLLGSTHISRWGYSCAKAVDEFLALAYFKQKKLPVIIVRFFNIVGPRQTGRYGMVIPRLISQALKNEPLTVYGDGTQTRCFTYIDDAVEGVIKLMETPEAIGQIFNLGSTEEVSIINLAKKIKNLTKSNSEIKLIPLEEVYGSDFEDMERRSPDLTKIKNMINHEPKTDIDTTLNRIANHFKHNSLN
jgi:UDP-glucose 4-epimerase